MLAEIQVLPQPLGTDDDRYAHVDAAIAVIEAAGLTYEVGALGTTVEGPPEAVWPLLRAVHEGTLAAGADGCVTVIKVAESGAAADDPTIAGLTGGFREQPT